MQNKNEERIMNDPSISYWAKEAIQELNKRDICDVINDLTLLKEYFESQFPVAK